jgi:hypothetical protein|tara:strand:+ start:3291 stop:3491 length:201 start_codon:yes stop_codon:yes gene_type:complete
MPDEILFETTTKERMIQGLMSKRNVSEQQKKKILSIIKYLEQNSESNNDIDTSYEINCLCEYIDWK